MPARARDVEALVSYMEQFIDDGEKTAEAINEGRGGAALILTRTPTAP